MIDNIRRGPAIVGNADLWRVAEPFFTIFFVPIQTSDFLLEFFHVDLFKLYFPTHRDQT